MKRVVLVHGWEGTPAHGWFPWLKKELEGRGFEVIAPQLPQPDEPVIEKWIPTLAAAVGYVDADTYFVGHSLGCQTIARYMQTLPVGTVVGGVVYVAGFFKRLTSLQTPEEIELAKPWLAPTIDFEQVRGHAPRSVAIFSDDDPFVPLDNQTDFKEKLGSEIIIEHGKEHFSGSNGCVELPVVFASVLKLAQ